MTKKRQRRREGDVVEIPLGDGRFAYGRVLPEPLFAFYDIETKTPMDAGTVVGHAVLFRVDVMNYAVTKGRWRVIGTFDLDDHLLEEPLFYKQDKISGEIFITKTGAEEIPATREQCEGLECAAVWEPEHVEDRIRDHFDGRPNKWLEVLRLS